MFVFWRRKTLPYDREAWPQVVHSIISGSPPPDMSMDYYLSTKNVRVVAIQENVNQQDIKHIHVMKSDTRTRSKVVRSDRDQKQQRIEHFRNHIRSPSVHHLVRQAIGHENHQGIEHIRYCPRSHTEVQETIYDNQQGIQHIRDCARSSSDAVQLNEHKNQQGIEHIRYCTRSRTEVVQTNKHNNQQGIEHIRYVTRSHTEVVQTNEHNNQQGIEHVRYCTRSRTEVVQAVEHENQQGIEHIRPCTRSTTEVVQANEHENQQGDFCNTQVKETSIEDETEIVDQHVIDYMQAKKMSTLFDDVLEAVEDYLQGNEKPILQLNVLQVLKLLTHFRVHDIQSGVLEELEDLYQKHDDIDKDAGMHYKKKSLEVMLRICDKLNRYKLIYGSRGENRKFGRGSLFVE